MSKERIVKFSDGTFGIQKAQRWFHQPTFLDLDDEDPTWRRQDSRYFRRCKKDLDKVLERFNRRTITFAPLTTNLADHM